VGPDVGAGDSGGDVNENADVTRGCPRRGGAEDPLVPGSLERSRLGGTEEFDALGDRRIVAAGEPVERGIRFGEQMDRVALVQRDGPTARRVLEVVVGALIAIDQVADPTTSVEAPLTLGRVAEEPDRSELGRSALDPLDGEALGFEDVGEVVADLETLVFHTDESDDLDRSTAVHPDTVEDGAGGFHRSDEQIGSLGLVSLVLQLEGAGRFDRLCVRREVRVEHRPSRDSETVEDLLNDVVSVDQVVHRFADALDTERVEATVLEERLVVLVDRRVQQHGVEATVAERDRQTVVENVLIQTGLEGVPVQVRVAVGHLRKDLRLVDFLEEDDPFRRESRVTERGHDRENCQQGYCKNELAHVLSTSLLVL